MSRKITVIIILVVIGVYFIILTTSYFNARNATYVDINIIRNYSTQEELDLILQAENEDPTSLGRFPPYIYEEEIGFLLFFFVALPTNITYVASVSVSPIINISAWMVTNELHYVMCFNRTGSNFEEVDYDQIVMANWSVEFNIDFHHRGSDSQFNALFFYNASKILVTYCYSFEAGSI